MKLNYSALIAKIAGGSLAGLAPLLGTLFPKQQALFTTVFGSAGLLVLVGGIVAQSLQPAAKIVANAPVVNETGQQIATNISSTSELLQPKGTP